MVIECDRVPGLANAEGWGHAALLLWSGVRIPGFARRRATNLFSFVLQNRVGNN
jgi:hypothetical protein